MVYGPDLFLEIGFTNHCEQIRNVRGCYADARKMDKSS